MKDYSIEYSGEVDSSPSDVTVTFSVVGETSDQIENIPIKNSSWEDYLISKDLEYFSYLNEEANKSSLEETMNSKLDSEPVLDLSKNHNAPLQTFTDYASIEIEEEVVEEVDLGSFYKGMDKSHYVTLKDISDDEYQKNVQKMMTEKLQKPTTTNTKTKKEKKKK